MIQRFLSSSNLFEPGCRILRLPDRIQSVELGMDEIEDRVSGAGKGIVLETPNDEMTSRMHGWLGGITGLKSVDASFETVNSGTRQQVFGVENVELFGPFQVKIATQAARIVVQSFVVLDQTDPFEIVE